MSDEKQYFTINDRAFVAALEELYRGAGAESRADGLARGIAPSPEGMEWESWNAPGDQFEVFVDWFNDRNVIAGPTTGRFTGWEASAWALAPTDEGAEHWVLVLVTAKDAGKVKSGDAPEITLHELRISFGERIEAHEFPIPLLHPEVVEAIYRDVLDGVAEAASHILCRFEACLPLLSD